MNTELRKKRPILTIYFSGLIAFIHDDKDFKKSKELTAVMLAVESMNLGLCNHHTVLSFYYDYFLAAKPNTKHFHHYNAQKKSWGTWPLKGRELTIQGLDSPQPDLTFGPSFKNILDLDELTQGLAAVPSKWVTDWPAGSRCRIRLPSGHVTATTLTDRKWGIGPVGGTPQPRRYSQVLRYELYGDPLATPSVTITARRPEGGHDEAIQFAGGAKIAISHLCPLGKDDGSSAYERDVMAYYEMSPNPVPAAKRSVLYPPENLLISGRGEPVTPKLDACPPVRGYQS